MTEISKATDSQLDARDTDRSEVKAVPIPVASFARTLTHFTRPSQVLRHEGIELPQWNAPVAEQIAFCAKHLAFHGMLQHCGLVVDLYAAYGLDREGAPTPTGVQIKATIKVPSVKDYTGTLTPITSSRIVPILTFKAVPLIDAVFSVCRILVLHELAEGFHYDGKPAIDPHIYRGVETSF